MQTKVTADPQLQNDGPTLKHRESQNSYISLRLVKSEQKNDKNKNYSS